MASGTPSPDTLGFLTANGSTDSHAVTLADGTPNRSPRAGKPYARITWADIARLVDAPGARPKERAAFVILSTYTEHDGRTHDVQRQRGTFGGLAVDIDKGNPSLAEVVTAVRATVGNVRAEIYSSSSAEPADRKWRVLLPLATPVPGADYHDTQLALFGLLERHGLACDVALSRPAQPIYLPNVPPKRRGPDGLPVFYQSQHLPGDMLALSAGHPVVVARDAKRARDAAEEAERAAKREARKLERLAHVQATGDTFEPIAHFNAAHTVADMLQRYGFQPQPQRPNHYRHPDSQKGSYATQDRGDHWVCVSEWAHSLNVGRKTSSGHRAGDAFDLYVAFEHGGNRSAAVRAYAAEVRPQPARTKVVPVVDIAPPGRVEDLTPSPTVSLADLRADLRADLVRAVESRAALVVCTPEPGVGKTTAAVDTLAPQFDNLVWVVDTHAAATETVARLRAAGHDAAAYPPRDATTCQCWTAEDAARLREEYPGNPHTLPMSDAIRVGNPFLSCLACPLSGLKKAAPVAATVDDFAAWADPFAEPNATVAEDTDAPVCEYVRRKREAEAARVSVMCQARFRKTNLPPVPLGTTRATVIDEHAVDALLPRQTFDLETLRATRDAMATAVANWRTRKGRMRFGKAREIEHEHLGFAEAVVGVADRMVEHMETLETEGGRRVVQLPTFELDRGQIPKRAHAKLSRLLVQGGLPEAFDAEALELVRRAAAGMLSGAVVYVEPVPGGGAHAQIVVGHRWDTASVGDIDTGSSSTFVFDAHADMAAIRKAFPHVLHIAPRGSAPLAVDAEQWWHEINPNTHPAVVVQMLELAIHERGFNRCGVILCKRHRDVLFPTTRPRGDRMAEDKEPDAERIANWGGRNGRDLADGTAEQRLARALALVERVRELRRFIARDEHGRLLVDHHRGAGSRGTNKFLLGTDGGVVLGQTRCPPGEVAGYMLATGRGDAVEASNGTWGDVEGELPAVGGGTTKRRWRGYACPEWADAARMLNRAALVQVAERFRTRLEQGVPVVLVAAEPAGLPVTDPPATIPEGVAAVVGAVRDLMRGQNTRISSQTANAATGCVGAEGTSELGGADACGAGVPDAVDAVNGGVSMRQPSTVAWANFAHPILPVNGGVSIGQPSTEHNPFPILIAKWPIETPAPAGASMDAIRAAVGQPERSVRRWLADAVTRGLLTRTGTGRWTRYALPVTVEADAGVEPVADPAPPPTHPTPVRVLFGVGVCQATTETPKKHTSTMKGGSGAHVAHDPQRNPEPSGKTSANGGTRHGLQFAASGVHAETSVGTPRGPGGTGGRARQSGGGVQRHVLGSSPSGGGVGNQHARAQEDDGGGQGTNAAQTGRLSKKPGAVGGGGRSTVSAKPGGVRTGETGGIVPELTGGADLEHANRLLAEAGELDNEAEPPRRTRPRSTPNAPAGPWTLPGVVCRPGPRGTDSPVLRALAKAAAEIRRTPQWTSPATWDAIRQAIPPDAAREEMARVEAALPPRFRGVRRE